MVRVLKAGMYSSVQDTGRYGYQEYGVPYAGVMDVYAGKMANTILGNNKNAAVIEMTFTGGEFLFEKDTAICISGADMSPKLNKVSIFNNKLVAVKSGDILAFGKLKSGLRCYLGVLGGFKTKPVLQSRSMYANITSQQMLQKGDVLPFENNVFENSNKHAHVNVETDYLKRDAIEVFKGPEYDRLSEQNQNELLSNVFSVSQNNNRMAYQLTETLKNNLEPIITSAVMPGTIQLTPDGKLIVLMRDCQTTGGYPRVLQLEEFALNVLAQKFTGQTFRFKLI